MARASESALDALHAAVATVLKNGLARESPSPQLIAQAIKFLKDNGVDAPAKSARISELADALRDLDLDQLAVEQRPN